MSKLVVKRMRFSGQKTPFVGLSLIIAAVSGGCSADVSRFRMPSSMGFNDDQSSNATGAIAAPTEPVRERSNLIGNDAAATSYESAPPSGTAYYPPRNEAPSDMRMTALPETAPPPPQQPAYTTAASPAPSQPSATWDNRPAPILDSSRSSNLTASGETIEVQPGDTLYGISKRHRVNLNELMSANGLSGASLKPGQKLVLPAGKSAREAALRPADATATDARPSTWRPNAEPVAVTAEAAPADWNGTYVVRSGDSLYAIARANNIKFTDLQRYNGITDVRRVKPGTVLKVPASASNSTAAAAPSSSLTPSNSIVETAPPPVASNVQQPTTILNSRERVAANETNTATDATPQAPVTDNSKLRWPVQGKIIAGFGQRPDGTHNDGVNLAVPMGTEIHAAESGVVAYAGDELKGYGNLILLRHDNGWVTAYAHSDELMVKRGDKVKRGQVIAKAGKTGQVDQPQVHFELRQGQRPVDPSPHMEKL